MVALDPVQGQKAVAAVAAMVDPAAALAEVVVTAAPVVAAAGVATSTSIGVRAMTLRASSWSFVNAILPMETWAP